MRTESLDFWIARFRMPGLSKFLFRNLLVLAGVVGLGLGTNVPPWLATTVTLVEVLALLDGSVGLFRWGQGNMADTARLLVGGLLVVRFSAVVLGGPAFSFL